MAKRLLEKDIEINGFISSPALRAITTCTYFAKAYGKKESDIITYNDLYNARPLIFLKAIKNANEALNSIAIFAHNPGITEFANELTDTKIDDMPTCGIFAIKAEIEHWKDFESAEKTFWFFDYPKAKD